MGSFTTPGGDIFAVDDAELHDQVLTLSAHVVDGNKSAALAVVAKAYETTSSIDYVILIAQEALTRVAVYLVNEATPPETIKITGTLGAIAHATRSLAGIIQAKSG
ncbi:hypothetical protein [Microbacterium paraoxydans]|uniref:hypothetical protein n=1 Tax=Microbacterium paraoxydans TaxID=199592 RepID=UPI001CFB305B|nr:hypothetical protein [Microbacterium paraoxydans]